MFYAVIEVDFEALLGEGEKDFALPLFAFVEGFAVLIDFFLFLGGEVSTGVLEFQVLDPGTEFMQVFPEVFIEQGVDRVFGITVEIDEGAEAFFRTLEEPVDGALLVGLEVVFIEVGEEILL